MTWYGESYAHDGGSVIAGTAWSTFNDVKFHFDTKHHVFSAGDSVVMGSYLQSYSDSEFSAFPDPIETRWVFEIIGGSGVIRLHAGLDPTWNYNNTAVATQDLGTHTITGPTTLVTDVQTSATKSVLLAYSAAPVVWIECLSGTVDVRQVKMRVWPTAGPQGAWRTAPGFTQSVGAFSYIHNEAGGYSAHYFDVADAWEEGVGIFDATDGATLDAVGMPMEWRPPSTAGTSGWEAYFDLNDDTGVPLDAPDKFARAISRSIVFVPDTSAPTSVPVGGTRADPREVYGDILARFRGPSGGPLVSTGVASWNPVNLLQVNEGYVAHEPCEFTPGAGVGPTFAFPGPAITAAPTSIVWMASGATASFVPTGNAFVITGYPANYVSPTLSPGSSIGHITGGVTANIVYPSYQWFDPTLPWDDGAKPLLYVTVAPVTGDPRDASHSVGINKRAADASIFKVHPTPDGTYRELRPGESTSDVSAAYPLKVKLYDGSFVTVAYMTLDP